MLEDYYDYFNASGSVDPGPCVSGGWLLTPEVTDENLQYFGSGKIYPAGVYRITYVEGSYNFAADGLGFTVVGLNNNPGFGFFITNVDTDQMIAPGTRATFTTQAAAAAASAGATTVYHHLGGKIGLRLHDNPYADNFQGTPPVTWRLCSYVTTVDSFIADTASLDCSNIGAGVTLSWTTTNAISATIDNGIGTVPVNGSIVVYPTSSTTYKITAIGPFNNASASTSVVTVSAVTVTPSISAPSISYFGGGAYYGPGLWKISYYGGAYKTSASTDWTVNYGEETGVKRTAFQITDGQGNNYDTPGHFETFSDFFACTSGNRSLFQPFYHQGGPLGVYLLDTNYSGNIAGSPSPTFALCGPGPSGIMTASAYTILPGASSTLTWAVANATTLSIDQGIGSISAMGTRSVSPVSTTTYTLTAVRYGLIFTTQATIVVTRPTPPQNVRTSGAAAGVVNLAWDASQNATGYVVQRATSPNGVYSVVGTPSANSFADTTPSPGSTYYYYVTATDGIFDSGYLFVVSGFSLLTPAAPAALTAQSVPGAIRLQWPSVFTAASYAVTRGLIVDGSDGALIASGLTDTAYSDPNVSPGVRYYYLVTATNAAATGPASPVASASASVGGFITPAAPVSAFVDGSRPNSSFS